MENRTQRTHRDYQTFYMASGAKVMTPLSHSNLQKCIYVCIARIVSEIKSVISILLDNKCKLFDLNLTIILATYIIHD